MPLFELGDALAFPLPEQADRHGLLALGGDLRPERLLLAYRHGIFPWPHEGLPLLWFSPDPRMVLKAADLHVPRRLARSLRRAHLEFRLDSAFEAVIAACAEIPRKDEQGTWITPEMAQAYTLLHRMGFAHCAEAWQGGRLVGGVYGVSIGRVFTGESMFTRVPGASKAALITLVHQLERWGIDILDAQLYTPHLAALGATEWPRARFLRLLRAQLADPERWPTRRGTWRLDEDLRHGPPAIVSGMRGALARMEEP